MLTEIIHQLKDVPEYFLALKSALAVLAMALPIYAGIRYFLYRRQLKISIGTTLNFFSAFILFAGLAFIVSSPLATHLPHHFISAYLFITCIAAAFGAVELIDVFLLQHYFVRVRQVYISPPLRTVIKLSVFCTALLVILRFVLHFNPLALVAIPTIATAGIALALQDTLKTFIAGLSLGRIIRLGEWISFQNKQGRVVHIDWARTTIDTTDGQRVYIPNTLLLNGLFSNLTAGNPANQVILKVTAPYDVSPGRVKATLLKCLESVPGIAHAPAPLACFQEFAGSGIVYGLFYWIEDYMQQLQIQDDVATRVWYAFQREGISMPYPTRTLQFERRTDMNQKIRAHVQEELERWTLAQAFYAEELKELSEFTSSRSYAPGEIIIRKGDPGRSLFTIVEGEVEIFGGPQSERPVATLGAREIFGEMSLLTGEPRAATVRAKTSVEVLEIDKAGIQHLMAKRPEISEKLAELVVSRKHALAAVSGQTKTTGGNEKTLEENRSLARRIRQFFGLA